MFQMDLTEAKDYKNLKSYLQKLENELGPRTQRLFYLSVPPQLSQPIIELLGTSGLARHRSTKLLLEKPFGTDFSSAKDLIARTTKYFKEVQIYRIDHYLAKEMSQNFIVFRDANYIFNHSWNNDFIEKIEIIASEKIGIEGRAIFYEQTGALRDTVQSHLLQLAALTLMENPEAEKLEEVPARRLRALKQLHIPTDMTPDSYAQCGQYEGYRDEVNNPGSTVETFVRLRLHSSDPRWEGVPIELVTGKSLAEKLTQIQITYKKGEQHESNQLIINVQPNEGIELRLWTKVPSYERRIDRHSLKLSFRDHFDVLPEAYEWVFLDAINSNHTLFTTSEEVLETWRIIEPIRQAWETKPESLIIYKSGTLAEDL
jgi:glucose-6-phosphate 1-dehydrogenase